MKMQPSAEVGMPLESVDTPALLVDLDRFERNLKTMSDSLSDASVRLRPHAKTHKSPVIALRQMELGAVGVCCQKVGEAEAMVEGGVPDVFISNEIVGTPKLERLVSLAKQAKIAVCADDPFHVSEYGAAAEKNGVDLDVFVELDVGAARCGLRPGVPVLRLARQITETPGLRFAGLQAYHGTAQHLRTPAERESAIRSAVSRVLETKSVLEENGVACKTVTGAGTGTYPLEAASGVYDEVQPGSYIFMDVDYAKNLDAGGGPMRSFQHSLFVYATIISRPTRDWAVLDAGHKAIPIDSGMPQVFGIPNVEYTRPSDEHGTLLIKDPGCGLKIGDKVRLIPAHCDPTVNLFDWYVGIRNNHVEVLWPITARGAMR
jgi:D-serine deaminase-like pyridoxal phosphate-dependent protein